MISSSNSLFGLFSCAVVNAGLAHATPDVITRDTVILGGGSSGTYAAVRLKDLGKSVIIVERNDYFGGHGETFYTADGRPINYGVEGFFNTNITLDYLARLNVPYEVRVPASLQDEYVNLRTAWVDAISQFNTLKDGVYRFPDPIPEDLLITFGEFVEKYHLENSVQAVFSHGSGNSLKLPTLYVIQYIGVPHAAALREGYLRPVNGIADLYTRARTILAPDVLYQTMAENVTQSSNGVEMLVLSSNGRKTLIQAKNMLVTIPPTLHHLTGFDLTFEETNLFSKWKYQSYYALIINETGLPDTTNIVNIDPDKTENPYSIPEEPFIWRIDAQRVPGYRTIKLVGNEQFSPDDAKALLYDTFERMAAEGTYPTQRPEIVRWGCHTPVTMMVTPDEIRQGFYERLYELQGQRSTFYTGAAWCSDYSTLLWGFTDGVVDRIIG
ncbi:uncharacterized protein CDV56_108096 [Aspergillus thermomutatus]|uniref:Amine oxidase domain-containing protein n=1 Tax=Aspergillus thermomutatus TaxID=41047 RepID=A0A397HYQ8_ASPTH|nr:uncharacterized protein CDV56_108096 [Aspergillus thermomutatus]RHZ67148.1 hypothetical protein CDV56_108096 [Aspergillus thermomutatus]